MKPKPIEYRDQSLADFGEAYRAGLVENPCPQCQGEGYGIHSADYFNPWAPTWVDDCEVCSGTGNGECPGCGESSAYLVSGDGRCAECITYCAVDLVDDIEAVHHGFKVFADADGNGKNSRLLSPVAGGE